MKKNVSYLVLILILLFVSNLIAEEKDSEFGDYLYPICVNSKVGYINAKGEIIIEPFYDTEVLKATLNINGKELKDLFFPNNAYFSDGRATIRKRKSHFMIIPWVTWYEYALINQKTHNLVFFDTQEPGKFKDSLAVIRVPQSNFWFEYQQLYGIINLNSEYIVLPLFFYLGNFYEDKALILYNDKYGYINKSGQLVIIPYLSHAGNFCDSLAYAKYSDHYGYIDGKGSMLINDIYDYAGDFSNGFAKVIIDDQNFFINKQGKNQFKKTWLDVDKFSEGFAKVIENGKTRYINTDGEYIFEKFFSQGQKFQEELAAVESENGLWGFIDKTGGFVIKPEFDYAESYNHGLAHVWQDGKMFYINKKGEFVSEVFWED